MLKPLPIHIKKGRSRGKSPTERTLGLLREWGYHCGIVERRIPNRYISSDLFGIIDIIALTPDGVMGVQSTGQDFAGHLRKITLTKADETRRWLKTPGVSLMLIGWRKVKGVNNRTVYAPRIQMIELSDLGE